MRILILLLIALPVMSQPALDAPREGLMLDHSGALRPLVGVGQSFTAGDVVQTSVLSAACGADLCVSKTADELSPGIAAPPGPAIISIEGRTASIFFLGTGQFARLHDRQLDILDWNIEGEVLAFRGDRIAVRRQNAVWVVASDGSVLRSLPGDTRAVLLFDELTIYATDEAMIIERPDGSQTRFDLAHANTIAQLSARYVQVSTPDGLYALCMEPGREQLSVLPEVQP